MSRIRGLPCHRSGIMTSSCAAWPSSKEQIESGLMRIDRIDLLNFKCFEEKSLDFDQRFTLLVGDNGAGKTSVLDALAIAAGIWLVKPPDTMLANSGRNILQKEIRLVSKKEGDRLQFLECKPVSIDAVGEIGNCRVRWSRQIGRSGSRTANAKAKAALEIIERHFSRVQDGHSVLSPVIAYYGAGRTWLPSRGRSERAKASNRPARRWEGFYDCLEERIRLGDLHLWFQREAIAFASRAGSWRPGYEVVKHAILRCFPDAENLWYDGDRAEPVLSIDGDARAFSNLSAGQRMMVALVADIAIKVVTQNPHLVPETGVKAANEILPGVLERTPGLVLIDEIDAHLHPKWQRRVVMDLKRTFPKIQFVCTSHSPFIIQSLEEGELRALEPGGSTLMEYAGRSIEDIAEEIQHVDVPQQSFRALELNRATERYFKLLQESEGEMGSAELKEAETNYRKVAQRYSANPGLAAILKLEAMARKTEKSK